jgi:DNA-binding MarR family transcriptional regulator
MDRSDPAVPAPLYTPDRIVACETSQSLGYLIVHVQRLLDEILEEELEPIGLTAAQFVVITQLYHRSESTPAGFCRQLGHDPGAMTRLINRIEKKGLVRRVRNPEDRRSVRLELTEDGLALCPQILPRVCNALNRLLRGFSDEEAALLEHMLQRILRNR